MEDGRWKQKKKEERSEKREESKRKNIRPWAAIVLHIQRDSNFKTG